MNQFQKLAKELQELDELDFDAADELVFKYLNDLATDFGSRGATVVKLFALARELMQ